MATQYLNAKSKKQKRKKKQKRETKTIQISTYIVSSTIPMKSHMSIISIVYIATAAIIENVAD